MVVFGQSGCVWEEWLYSGKVVVFGQKGLFSGKMVVFGQSGCIWEEWLCSGKVVVFGRKLW